MHRPIVSLVVALTLTACGSSTAPSSPTDGGTDASAATTIDQGCTSLASVYCARIESCAPFFVSLQYGDTANCQSRIHDQCVVNGSAPNSGDTGDDFTACAAVASSVSCDDLFAGTLPKACQPVAGKGANGASCTDSSQCQSAFCATGAGSLCGVCVSPPTAGSPCAAGNACPGGLTCAGGNCVAKGKIGDACGTTPCIDGATCFNGTCTAPGASGATCDVQGKTAPVCDLVHGLFCNPTTSKCGAIVDGASLGATCGLSASTGTLTTCGAIAYCKASGASTTSGACTLRPADGAACTSDAILGVGPCTPPAQCISGKCQKPDPAACK
jgi:hypothetical protein